MPTFLNANGEILEVSSIGNNILFTGREYNAETGDYYFRARSMHPMVGRFMQKDPLMYVDGMNDLIFCLNNSISNIDPLGFAIGKYLFIGGKYVYQSVKISRTSTTLKGTRYTISPKTRPIFDQKLKEAKEKEVQKYLAAIKGEEKKQKESVNKGLNYLAGHGLPTFLLMEHDNIANGLYDLYEKSKELGKKIGDKYNKYDQWGKDTYRYSANWWFRLFHGGNDYDGCNGFFDPDDVADFLWLLTAPI